MQIGNFFTKERVRKAYFRFARLRASINFAVKMVKDGQQRIGSYIPFLEFLEKIEINFSYLSIIMSCVSIGLSILKMIHGAWATQGLANRAERGTNVFMGFFGIIVAIVGIALQALLIGGITTAIVTAAPILLLIGAIRGMVENTLKIGAGIYDRFFSDKCKNLTKIISKSISTKNIIQLKDAINERIDANSKIANRLEGLVTCALAVTAAVLFFTPLAPIGTLILSGLFVYGVLNAVNANPIKWAAFGIYRLTNKFNPKLAQKYNFLYKVDENDIKNKYEMDTIIDAPISRPEVVVIERPIPPKSAPITIPNRSDKTNVPHSWDPSLFSKQNGSNRQHSQYSQYSSSNSSLTP